jgi:hypothetical protein
VHGEPTVGRRLQCLTVLDAYTREGLTISCARSITAEEVVQVLQRLFVHRGALGYVTSDDDPAFLAQRVTTHAFACGFNVFGADHVAFAAAYPYGRNKGEYFLESRRRFVDVAQIGAEAHQKIYEENAKALLHLA